MCTQGAHQVAQKSSSTTLPCRPCQGHRAGLRRRCGAARSRAPPCPGPAGGWRRRGWTTQPPLTASAAPSSAASPATATRERGAGRAPAAGALGVGGSGAVATGSAQRCGGAGELRWPAPRISAAQSRATALASLVGHRRQRAQQRLQVQRPVHRPHGEEGHVGRRPQLEVAGGIALAPPGRQGHRQRRRQHHDDRLLHLLADHRQHLAQHGAERQMGDAQQRPGHVLEPEAEQAQQHQPAGVAHARRRGPRPARSAVPGLGQHHADAAGQQRTGRRSGGQGGAGAAGPASARSRSILAADGDIGLGRVLVARSCRAVCIRRRAPVLSAPGTFLDRDTCFRSSALQQGQELQRQGHRALGVLHQAQLHLVVLGQIALVGDVADHVLADAAVAGGLHDLASR